MLRTDDTHYYWRKGDVLPLGVHFTTREFTCPCTLAVCVEQRIAKQLIASLNLLRDVMRVPITVTSGRRCATYQEELRALGYETASGVSRHVDPCDAADIIVKDVTLIPTLATNAALYFRGIGVGQTFIHVDCRPKDTRWSYVHR